MENDITIGSCPHGRSIAEHCDECFGPENLVFKETTEDNLTIILREFEELKGQFIINIDHNIERLIAIAEDDMDYYFVTYNGREIFFGSCVGRIIPLKNKIDQDDYDYLVHIAKLNHWDQLNYEQEDYKTFLKAHKEEIESPKNYDTRYLTPICWDIN